MDELDDDALATVVDLAEMHRVSGSLAAALRRARRPLPVPLAKSLQRSAVVQLRALRVLTEVGSAFDDAGLRWAVVKGPVVAARWPEGATARSYEDLDLLVAPAELASAVQVLVDLGFEHRNKNWVGFRRLGVAEIPLDDGGTVIDLHWHLQALATIRAHIGVDTAELLDRTVPRDLGALTVPTLDGADTLVHLCVHHALAGARRLVELRDIHLVARSVDPALASQRLGQAGAKRLAAPVIDRCERVFGALGASSALELCGHRGWIRLNRFVDASWSALVPFDWTPFPGAIVGAGRPSAAATMGSLTSNVVTFARTRLGLSTITSPAGPLDWDFDAGDAEIEYTRYLADVAGGLE